MSTIKDTPAHGSKSESKQGPAEKKGRVSQAKEVIPLMKNPLLYIGTVVIMSIMAITFILMPTSRNHGYNGHYVFGSYSGKPIEYKQGSYMPQMLKYFNDQNRDQQEKDSDSRRSLWRRAFEATAYRQATISEFEASGDVISTHQLKRSIRKLDRFQGADGFSLKLYNTTSENERAELAAQLKEDLKTQALESLQSKVRASQAEKDFIKSMNTRSRSFSIVSFPFSSYPDSEVKAYVEANRPIFRSLKVSYIRTEKSEGFAKKLLKGIQSGKNDFDKALELAASDYSGSVNVERAQWELKKIFEDDGVLSSLMALKAKEYSPVYETTEGGEWYFFYCVEAARDIDLSKQDEVTKAYKYITNNEKGKLEAYCQTKASEFADAVKAKGFDAAAKGAALEVKKLSDFPLNFKNMPLLQRSKEAADMTELSTLSSDREALKLLFSLKKDEVSKGIVLNKAIVVFRMDDEKLAEADATGGIIDYYYDSFVQQYLQSDQSKVFLASKKMKNNFEATYSKHIGQ